MNRKDTAR